VINYLSVLSCGEVAQIRYGVIQFVVAFAWVSAARRLQRPPADCTTGSGDDGSITACGNKEYCCNSGIKDRSCDCDSGKGVFSLADGIAQTIIGVSNLEATTIPPVHSRTRTATSNSATTTPSSWSHTTRPSSTGASPTESGASQTSAAATTPLIHRKSFKIGMGVGLGLLLLILAGLIVFWCFWRHYKRQWPFRAKPVTDDTSSDAHHGDDRIPRITQPAPAPFPHPYGPAAVGGAPSPIATPLPQSHQEQSRGASGIAPTNNPYDSAYSLRSRDLDDTRYANSHPYGAPQPLERIGESGVPQPGLELQDFRDRDYRGPSRTYHGV
jgi:hypothetical protein